MLTWEEKASILKIIGDKTRLQMIAFMTEQPMCVCEFVELFQMSQPSISQHIKRLKSVDLVSESRKGQWIFYSLNKETKACQFIQPLIQEVSDIQQQLKVLDDKGLKVTCRG